MRNAFFILMACCMLLSLSVIGSTQEGDGMAGSRMTNGDGNANPQTSFKALPGASIFRINCVRCHPNGENIVVPALPMKGSSKLVDFDTFLGFIRNPKMPDGSAGVMPAFPSSIISDQQAKVLYQFIAAGQESGIMGGYGMGPGIMGGYGMGRGMMGGYGMGRGMMGGYGMGPGMMGPNRFAPECQKFYEETRSLRKDLHDKRFEYFEALRNASTTGEQADRLESEIRGLQDKIYSKAPIGCMW